VNLAIIIVISCLLCSPSNAFVKPHLSSATTTRYSRIREENIKKESINSGRRKTTQLRLGWEDVVYNAQSMGTNLAGISLRDGASISSFPLMYGAGLLASVSPCVWGLLPLTMSYISAAAGERDDKKATLPTLAFASGLATVFCTLGLVAASLGGGLYGKQDALTAFVVSIGSSGICLVMGMQLLEFIDIPLPSLDFDVLKDKEEEEVYSLSSISSSSSTATLQQSGSSVDTSVMGLTSAIVFDDEGNLVSTTLVDEQEKQRKNRGSLFRTFLLGGSSALVSSPCATPVLTSILAYVAKTNDPVLGSFLLLGYTLGYSTPLLLVAASGGQALANLSSSSNSGYGKFAPWITPLTGGILLWYGINGILTATLGDPSMVALAPVLE